MALVSPAPVVNGADSRVHPVAVVDADTWAPPWFLTPSQVGAPVVRTQPVYR